jgi:short-subunit dehydrogenase involved in D-alanine esterification of teichoic acids
MNDALRLLPADLFAGEIAFITGGGSGINFAIARAFARLGAQVVICGRSAERLAGASRTRPHSARRVCALRRARRRGPASGV